jgi:hypothetical protein
MKKLTVVLAAAAAAAIASLTFAAWGGADGNKKRFSADDLSGYREVPTSVSSGGIGSFTARLDEGSQTIAYELRYGGLSDAALQAHIHFGSRFTAGGVSAFLCGPQPNAGDKPACPAGTSDEALVTGTIDAADVVGPSGQGIAGGELAELVAAMRRGVAYVNVHTAPFPAGEIRGQLNDADDRDD